MQTANFVLEKDFSSQGFTHVIGTDEVGRGPLCGPVLACAVSFKDPNFEIPAQHAKSFELIRDSKKLSEKQREKIYELIHEHFYVGIGLCDHETIDRINILEASFLSMKKAVQELTRNLKLEAHSKNIEFQDTSCLILVDGNKEIPSFSIKQYPVIGGDGISKSIAAASIVAKVTRDRLMQQLHEKYPVYGLDKHKGYGTKLHLDMLKLHGPCEIHRKSFAPVKKCLS